MTPWRAWVNPVHNDSKSHKCDICGNCFASKPSLLRHIQSAHETSKRHFCDICGKCFPKESTLRRHLQNMHNIKPHKCDICERSFARKAHLKSHIQTVHELSRPHKCDFCQQRFSLKSNMKKHIQALHKANVLKPENFAMSVDEQFNPPRSEMNDKSFSMKTYEESKPQKWELCKDPLMLTYDLEAVQAKELEQFYKCYRCKLTFRGFIMDTNLIVRPENHLDVPKAFDDEEAKSSKTVSETKHVDMSRNQE